MRKADVSGWATALLLALTALASQAQTGFAEAGQAQESGACDAQNSEPVRIAGFDDNFDIRLADGRLIYLPGVEFRLKMAPDSPAPPPVSRLLANIRKAGASEAHLAILTPVPDRWGRFAGRMFFPQPSAAADENPLNLDIAQSALETGLGVYRPDGLARACRSVLLAAEQRARAAGVGIWAWATAHSAGHPIVRADDRQAVAAAGYGLTLVEGKIVATGETASRIYLNFGEIRGVDLALTISKRNRAVIAALALEKGPIVGQTLRARGLIDRRFGPQMEITEPDALEIVP